MYSLWRKMSRQEVKHTFRTALVAASAEVVGTGILMFLGCMGGTTGFKEIPTSNMQGAMVFGMTVTSIIQIFGHVSGAHLNPAVTVAAWVWGSISLTVSIAYIIAQLIGATAGYGILLAITPDHVLDLGRSPNVTGAFCGTVPSPYLTTVQAFFAEFLITTLLIFLCCGIWDKRNAKSQDSVAIKFGILVAAVDLSEGTNNATAPFCGTVPSPYLTQIQAFFAEFVVTCLLVFMCCGCWDKRNESNQDSTGIKFGILVAAISLSAGPYTGASMNPARTFAPSLYYNVWDSHWIYWVAPLAAGFVIPFLYKIVFIPKSQSDTETRRNHQSRQADSTQVVISTNSENPPQITLRKISANVVKQ